MQERSPPKSSTRASAERTPRPGSSAPTIALFVEDGGGDWHARRLARALEARGARVVTTALKFCAFDTATPSGLDIPGLGGALPDGAFVRAVSTGTLEQITLRLGILHALRESGVRVWNDARAIERCVDKSTATFLLKKAGLPTPVTRAAEGAMAADAFRRRVGGRTLVLKPLFGSQGNGVRRLQPDEALPAPDEIGNVYYLQEYLRAPGDTSFEDWRIFVSRGRVLGAMVRRSKSWVTNMHQGAEAVPLVPDAETQAMALAATAAVGADYAGVDLIRASDGRLLVLEVNSNPAWKGLQSVVDVEIAEALAADFLDTLGHVEHP